MTLDIDPKTKHTHCICSPCVHTANTHPDIEIGVYSCIHYAVHPDAGYVVFDYSIVSSVCPCLLLFRAKTFCTFATSVVCHSMHHKIMMICYMSGFKEIIYVWSYLQCSHVISKKWDPQMQKKTKIHFFSVRELQNLGLKHKTLMWSVRVKDRLGLVLCFLFFLHLLILP